jgi:hypothetical protein
LKKIFDTPAGRRRARSSVARRRAGHPSKINFSGTREGRGAGDLGGGIFDESGFDDFKI